MKIKAERMTQVEMNILTMKEIGMSDKEIAESVGISETQVKKSVPVLRVKLKNLVANEKVGVRVMIELNRQLFVQNELLRLEAKIRNSGEKPPVKEVQERRAP